MDTEDSKNDTMVDVVFKKALKEFRLNIFNSYSTALAVRLANTKHKGFFNSVATRSLVGSTPSGPNPPLCPPTDGRW